MRRSIPKHATLWVIKRIHSVQLEIRRQSQRQPKKDGAPVEGSHTGSPPSCRNSVYPLLRPPSSRRCLCDMICCHKTEEIRDAPFTTPFSVVLFRGSGCSSQCAATCRHLYRP